MKSEKYESSGNLRIVIGLVVVDRSPEKPRIVAEDLAHGAGIDRRNA